MRYDQAADLTDLDEAIWAAQEEAAAISRDHPGLADKLATLGAILMIRFDKTDALADLDAAIQAQRDAIAAAPAGPCQAGATASLGRALYQRFERTGRPADLEEAVRFGREAVAAVPAADPDRADLLAVLNVMLQAEFERTGAIPVIDDAIQAGRAAVATTAPDGPSRARWLTNLGNSLQARFKRAGLLPDLDEAIEVGRQAVTAAGHDHPDLGVMLSNLGSALQNRFQRTGSLADLDEAVQSGRRAAAAERSAEPPGPDGKALSNLAVGLFLRFGRTGAPGDLDEAIQVLGEAIAGIPEGHPDRIAMQVNLSSLLQVRSGRSGEMADLDEAVQLLERAVSATDAGQFKLATMLSGLGNGLRLRFERTGTLGDLEQAARVSRQAVAVIPADHPEQAGWLANLGVTLKARFERTGELRNLDEAIDMMRQALAATPDGDTEQAARLSNLGTALRARFSRTGVLADLDEAIRHGKQAVTEVPDDHPQKAAWLSNLGLAWLVRYERTGALADLEEAIELGRLAVARAEHHPDGVSMLGNYGLAMKARYNQTAAPADLAEALDAFRRGLEMKTAGPSERIRLSRVAAELAAPGQPQWAAGLMERAVRLLPEVAPRQLERSDQQDALGGFSGLAGDAAALVLAAPAATAPEHALLALQLLEAGRAVLYSQALEVRSDLTDLTAQHPGLAGRLARIRDLLDSAGPGTDQGAGPATWMADGEPAAQAPAGLHRVADDRRRLARELTEVLAEIRAQDGFGSFALPPSADELLSQAADGPVVTLNVSAYRSDALLLTGDGVTCLPLPGLTRDEAIDQVNAFHRALDLSFRSADPADQVGAPNKLSEVLEWLWEVAAGPVLATLGYRTEPAAGAPWPRIWWASGGLMGLLPLHAAGYHTDPADQPGRRTVLDRVVSSYTPTIAALRYARRPVPPTAQVSPPALIVAMPTTPGLPHQGRLPSTGEESRLLASRLPGAIMLSEPADPYIGGAGDSRTTDAECTPPTRTHVLGYLSSCPVAHFSCHGISEVTDPSRSRLLLHDHRETPLTVASLSALRLDQARLAYLSACSTAISASSSLVDEAIHLTSAFQLAGYRHVIGTLWPVYDQIAAGVADRFYRTLISAGKIESTRASLALHLTVRAVRDAYPSTPSLWAAHIHAGA